MASSYRINRPMPSATPNPSGRLLSLGITVSYPDGSVKTQTWVDTVVQDTYKLVLSEDLLQGPDAHLLKPSSDWRHNPCMVRYPRGDSRPEPICQLGGRRRLAAFRHRWQHGFPHRFELTVSHGSDAAIKITLDRACLDETAALLFLPQNDLAVDEQDHLFSNSDWRENAVLIRVTSHGARDGVFPRSGTAVERQRSISFARDQCGIGSPVRNPPL